ncbi:MAG: hypothetical protein ACPL1K_07730, partial [Candidatus Kryptoniota bacterium]
VIDGRDDDFGVEMHAWNFIRINDITATQYTLLDSKAVPRVFGETRNVTRLRFSNDGVYNIGIPREEVERVTRTRIQNVDLVRTNLQAHERLDGGKLMIYSPAPFQPRIRNEQIEIRRQNEFLRREKFSPVVPGGMAKQQMYPQRVRAYSEQKMIVPPSKQATTESARSRLRRDQTQVPKEETNHERHRHR